MSDNDELKRVEALVDELQRVMRTHGLDPETALGALARVAAGQVEAFVMNEAGVSGTTLDRKLFREASQAVDRFSSAVLGNIAWTIRGGG